MKTRLTEVLSVEHPVMLAGMGGVSYASLVSAVSEAGASAAWERPPWATSAWWRRWPRCGRPPTSHSGSTCSPPCPVTWPARWRRSLRAVPRSSWPGWGTRRGGGALPPSRRPGRQHVRQGRPRPSGPRCRVRHRGGPGHRGRGHTGQVATMPLVPQIVDAVGGQIPVVAAGGSSTAGAWPPRWPSAPTVCGWGRGSSPPRGPGRGRLQGRAAPDWRGRDHHQPCLLRQDDAGGPQPVHRVLREHPDELRPFPDQLLRSMEDGAFHLGAARTPPVSTRTRVLPHRAGGGAIHSLTPAADLVAQIVDQAEQALARVARLGVPAGS